ncbi:MAG: nucleoside 2-deoxyribosyltransferase domain-containing protein [Clostridia bacterium]
MILNYSTQDVIENKKSIFLAGPIPREKGSTNWRMDAIKLFEKYKYDGLLYIPQDEAGLIVDGDQDETKWELKALAIAKKIMFWVPREFPAMLGLTTNVEFGMWIQSKKVIYGRPDNALMIDYLDLLYEKYYHQKPENNLDDLIKKSVIEVNEEYRSVKNA